MVIVFARRMLTYDPAPHYIWNNPRLAPGTAVVVEGLRAQPEWNGKRGLVQSFDKEKGRHRLLVKGRAGLLGVRLACCRLESMVEHERQLHAAERRAEIEEAVRVALEVRGAATVAEPGPEPADHSA